MQCTFKMSTLPPLLPPLLPEVELLLLCFSAASAHLVPIPASPVHNATKYRPSGMMMGAIITLTTVAAITLTSEQSEGSNLGATQC